MIRRGLLALGGIIILSCIIWAALSYHGPTPPVEIFKGITYGCERLPDTAQSGGLFHWACADLKTPGVNLYVTPIDPIASEHGMEYRLRHVSTAVSDDHLAVAINATLFNSMSTLIRLPADLACSNETVVADHVVNHVHPHTYLFWWDDELVSHLETTKPPSTAVLARARWGLGGQQAVLYPGGVTGGTAADRRTFVAADPEKKLVWIACFDRASYDVAARVLAEHGAKIATALDGGTSTTMVIGSSAKHARAGTVTGNWRPVATQFGFRADALP